MGGSGGGGGGGGYDGESGAGGQKTGGGSNGGSGGGGGNGGRGSDPCQFQTSVILASPNPSIVPTLSVGNVLDVALNTSGPNPIVEIVAPAGVAGTLAGMPRLRQFIDCLLKGVAYEFEVSAINGGRVDGHLRNK